MCTVIVLMLSCIINLTAQNPPSSNLRQYRLDISVDSTSYKLPDNRIVAGSETVRSDSLILVKETDYTLDYTNGIIYFIRSELLSGQIYVSYFVIPDFLTQKYYRYEKQVTADSLLAVTGIRKRQILFAEDNRLLITGSKTFALTFSNQESYDLKQSLYLQLDGELSDNMKIEGRLSDSQTPLTPEGDSREISSLDQVYLKLFGRQYAITFGDQEHEFDETELMRYKARFEGINLIYSDKIKAQGAYAVNGGKPATNIIQGVEGKQGPYFLTANTGGQNVLVIAGSERVSVNGESFCRGDDYTIDYSEGSLFFKKLITSNSRIIVNFQYSDDFYRQNLYLSSTAVNLTPELTLRSHIIKQTDSKDNPLQYTFSEADKDSLRLAGDKTVWGQGVFEVEPGGGQYIRKLDSDNNVYYEYAENDSTANYLIYFSYVGSGAGDYEPFASNKYIYRGRNQGSWLPIKKLIAPTDLANYGINLEYSKGPMTVFVESVLTNQDSNTFSGKDDKDNQSYIIKANAGYRPVDIRYDPEFMISYKIKDDNSFTFSNLVPDNELYEFATIPVKDDKAQQQFDMSVKLSNVHFWRQRISGRYKQVRDMMEQRFIKTETQINQYKLLPGLMWYGLYSRQNFSDSTMSRSDLNYHDLDASWKWNAITLRSKYLWQQDEYQYSESASSELLRGIRLTRFNPSMNISDDTNYSTELAYSNEQNQRKSSSNWGKISTFNTWQINQTLNQQFNTLNLNFTHREADHHLNSENTATPQDLKFDLLDLKSSHQLWDNSLSLNTYYQLNRQEFLPRIKELQYVGNGLGSYNADSVYVVNGDYDYVFTTSGAGQLANDINANLSANYHLSNKIKPNSFWHRFHIDSSFQVSHNTTAEGDAKLYLMLWDNFFKSDSTKFGRRFMQHNLWMDIYRDVVTGNLKYEVSNTMDNRYQEFSKTYIENRELELDWKQIRGYKLQTSILNGIEKNSRYSSEVCINEISANLFRNVTPAVNFQFNTSFRHEQGNSTTQTQPYTINSLRINPQTTLFLRNKYRITGNFLAQYNQRYGSNLLLFLPEKRDGLLFTWSLQTQYRLNSFTSGVFEYSGKSYPQVTVLHELKMEFRAEL